MLKFFKREKNNYTLYGMLFGLLFPVGGTIIDSIDSYGALTWVNVLKVQGENHLIWIIDSAPFWLGLFARFGGLRQDELIEQSSMKVRDTESYPDENPHPIFRVTLEGEILYSNQPGLRFLESWGRELGSIIPDVFIPPLKRLNDSNRTAIVEFNDGDRTFICNLVLVQKRKYVNIYSSDITELKKIESDLIHAKEEAEKANQAKSEFLARMSHELRTPMNAVLGFAQVLEMDYPKKLTDSQQDSVSRIISAGNHLLDLINEVLDLSSIESNELKLSIKTVDIIPIVDNVVSISKPLADENGISLRYEEVPRGNCYAEIDYLRFKQVVLNLVSNAIKYNTSNGTVIISYEKQANGRMRLGIRDTGHGISDDKKELLFKPFQRFDSDLERIEGTGIGLTISKRFIELMGGSIGFDSVSGEGSFFYIDISISDTPPVPIQIEMEASSSQLSLTDGNKKRILYIEDIPANVALLEKILFTSRTYIEIVSASNALDGIRIAQIQNIDLILMDIHLPGMDGLTAFKKLQTLEKTQNTPVIALTADALEADIKKALDLGFYSYITKPIDIPEFLKSIDSVLE